MGVNGLPLGYRPRRNAASLGAFYPSKRNTFGIQNVYQNGPQPWADFALAAKAFVVTRRFCVAEVLRADRTTLYPTW